MSPVTAAVLDAGFAPREGDSSGKIRDERESQPPRDDRRRWLQFLARASVMATCRTRSSRRSFASRRRSRLAFTATSASALAFAFFLASALGRVRLRL